MKLAEIADKIEATVHCQPEDNDMDLTHAGASDLMSDVLAHVAYDILLITGLLSRQVIRTADMMDISAVCFTRGKEPGQEIIDLARSSGIALMSTDLKTYTACGRLYEAGLRGIDTDAA